MVLLYEKKEAKIAIKLENLVENKSSVISEFDFVFCANKARADAIRFVYLRQMPVLQKLKTDKTK